MRVPSEPRLPTPHARARWTAACWSVCTLVTGWAVIVASLAGGPSTIDLSPLFAILIYGAIAAFLATAWGTLHTRRDAWVMGSFVFPRRLLRPTLSWAGFYAPLLLVGVFMGFKNPAPYVVPSLFVSLIFGAMVALFADAQPR